MPPLLSPPRPPKGSISVSVARTEPVAETTATLHPVLSPGSMAATTCPLSGGWRSFCRRLVEYTKKLLSSAASVSSLRHSRSSEGTRRRFVPSAIASSSAPLQLACSPGGAGALVKWPRADASNAALTSSSISTDADSTLSASPRLIAST
eukprot:scaffold47392_cov60-Phaeocystis_antarctica.AAC.3